MEIVVAGVSIGVAFSSLWKRLGVGVAFLPFVRENGRISFFVERNAADSGIIIAALVDSWPRTQEL